MRAISVALFVCLHTAVVVAQQHDTPTFRPEVSLHAPSPATIDDDTIVPAAPEDADLLLMRVYERLFENAAEEYDVPVEVLQSIAFVETRWRHISVQETGKSGHEQPPTYGIMGLRNDGYFGTSLRWASALIGHTQEEIAARPDLNIRAAAAYLSLLSGGLTRENPLEEWRDAIERYSGIPQAEIAAMQSYDVFRTIDLGRSSAGARVHQHRIRFDAIYDPDTLMILSSPMVYMERSGENLRVGTNATDYGSAIWVPACSSGPSGGNFNYGRTETVTHVAIHITDGSYAGSISWFQDCNRAGVGPSSAHYVIRSSDGQITQMVREADTAYHVASQNSYSIGIEHEAIAGYCTWMTSSLYSSSAALLRDICSRKSINCSTVYDASLGWDAEFDRNAQWKIKGHTNFPNTSKTCPTSCWNWSTYRGYVGSSASVPSVTTNAATSVTSGSATLNATITSDGGAAIVERRFEWGIAPSWTSFTSDVVVAGSTFRYALSGLSPNTTMQFRSWAKNSAGWTMGNTMTFTTSSVTNYTLTVTGGGAGQGTVTGNGINCTVSGGSASGSCSSSYPSGTVVSLTATPTGGSTFNGWSGACSGTGSCSVTMTTNRSVSASFSPPVTNYTLTVTGGGSGQGTITGNGINCTVSGGGASGSCSSSYPSGTVVSLTATPTGGSTFNGWSGACSGTGSCSVTMSTDRSVSASFSAPVTSYTLTVTGSGNGQGTVTGSGINCTINGGVPSGMCSASHPAGTVVSLTATPGGGSTFGGWSGPCTGTGSCAVTMSTNRTVSASFAGQSTTYVLTVTGGGSGQGTITGNGINCSITGGVPTGTCSASFGSGNVVTMAASPAGGSTFGGWSGGGCSGSGTCQVVMSGPQTVTATFNADADMIVNGGFESAPATGNEAPGWNIYPSQNSGHSLIIKNGPAPRAGTNYAQMGSTNDTEYDFLLQTVAIPSSASAANLTFWVNITTEETSSDTAYDALWVAILDLAGNLLGTPAQLSNLDAVQSGNTLGNYFKIGPIDVLAYQGSPIQIGFAAYTDYSLPTTFLIDDVSLTTNVPVSNYTLSVTGNGTGQGTVTGSGINCTVNGATTSGTCSASYPSGTVVPLSAAASGNSTFSAWGGSCSGTGSCSVVMTANRTVSASFIAPVTNYSLSVTGGGTGVGMVVGSGINCMIGGGNASGTCIASFASGTSVSFTALPIGGSTFSGWSGACAGSGPCSFTMTVTKSLSASFAAPAAARGYFVIPACRLIDTRNPAGPSGGPTLAAASTRNIATSGSCGIPSTAIALAINVTAVTPAATGWMTLFQGPGTSPRPLTSTLNYRTGKTRANSAITAVGVDGSINVFNGGSQPVNFIIDVFGYFQ